jgi:hypothetical protein
MNSVPVVAFLASRLSQSVFSENKLSWTDVQLWIKHHGDAQRYGYGRVQTRLPSQKASNRFIELRQEQIKSGSIRITASAYVNPRSLLPATCKTWVVQKLDAELQEQFGTDTRIRISL